MRAVILGICALLLSGCTYVDVKCVYFNDRALVTGPQDCPAESPGSGK